MKKRIISILLVGALAAGMAACGEHKYSGSSVNLTEEYEKETKKPSGNTTTNAENQEDGGEIEADFTQSYVDFSMEILKRVSASGENCMISPLSILTALTMTENGADGETLSQMGQVLAKGTPVDKQKETLTAYQKKLPDTKLCHMNQANSVWIKNTDDAFHVNEDFLRNSIECFDADIYSAPFDDQTLSDINSWVAEETEEMIPKMLDQIDPGTVMFLINAVAFEAEWQEPYDEYQISSQEFYHEDQSSELVDMMFSEESRYLEDENTTGFIKPYKEGYSFVAFLPEEGISMEDYLEEFSAEKYWALMEQMQTGVTVKAAIPKFTSEFGVELMDVLSEMGMPLAFDPENADFSGLGSYDEGNLYINMVLHKTYINVDELGTKAGAATVVGIAEYAALEREEPKVVTLDRPFVYAIIDNENQLPVFIGVVEKIAE